MTGTQAAEPMNVTVVDTPTPTTVVLALLPLPALADNPGGTCSALVAALEQLLRQPVSVATAPPLSPVPGIAAAPQGRLTDLRAWMLENLSEPMSLDELAKRAFLSRRQFTRDFRAEVGTSPTRWLLEQRLDEATRMLEGTDLPVDRIAEATGFPTSAAFRAHFKRRTTMTPTGYRTRRRDSEPNLDERRAA